MRLVRPHSHHSADSVDPQLESSAREIWALKISLLGLLATAAFQVVIVLISGSVALLADTIHNFSDALTAVPLWIAFVLGRRAASSRHAYGYGRAEDLAGLFIVLMIALSAGLAGWESVQRLRACEPDWRVDGNWDGNGGANPGAKGGADARNKRPPNEIRAVGQSEGLLS